MEEQPVFFTREPPDFSLLQQLLCLSPEPWWLVPQPASTGGNATSGPCRMGISESPPRPQSPSSLLGENLGFLQESVLLLSLPGPLLEHPGVSAVPTGSLDALSLINLKCQLLADSTGSGTGRGRRHKLALPQRGADPWDPSFRGVTIRMRLDLTRGGTGDCRLLITARGHRIPTWRRRSSISDDDAPVAKRCKRCTSCKTCLTPMWRKAEGGTILCNACGIRYRKYHVRCQGCWNIPGKIRTLQCPRCPQCPTWPAGARGDSKDPTESE